jgi:[ribosomal protein S18]-alanine N-acetyltransferase
MTGDSFKIRRAVAGDLPDLMRIETASFTCPWSEESIRHDLESHLEAYYVVACRDDGTVAGYAAFWRSVDEAMVTNIAVAPEWRGQGAGKKLLEALIARAVHEKLHCMVLEVRKSNAAACRLYRSAGFNPVGIRRGYYTDNQEDAIIMQKIINGRE